MDQNIATTVLIVSALIIFFTYTTSAYTSIQALSLEKERFQEVTEQANRLAEKEEEKREDHEEFQEHKEDFESMVPTRRDDARTLMIVNAMAGANNISILDIKVNEGARGQRRSSYRDQEEEGVERKIKTIDMEFEGKYEDFAKFLTALERSRRIFDTVAMEFESHEGSSVYTFKASVQTYWIE